MKKTRRQKWEDNEANAAILHELIDHPTFVEAVDIVLREACPRLGMAGSDPIQSAALEGARVAGFHDFLHLLEGLATPVLPQDTPRMKPRRAFAHVLEEKSSFDPAKTTNQSQPPSPEQP